MPDVNPHCLLQVAFEDELVNGFWGRIRCCKKYANIRRDRRKRYWLVRTSMDAARLLILVLFGLGKMIILEKEDAAASAV